MITEYPPHTPPDSANFPKRNRIMAALSNGTVVVEGKQRSGTTITAGYALELGRKLFAVPGPADRYTSDTPNELIKKGAIPVTEAIDVLEQFLDAYTDEINLSASKQRPKYDFYTVDENKTLDFITSIFGKTILGLTSTSGVETGSIIPPKLIPTPLDFCSVDKGFFS